MSTLDEIEARLAAATPGPWEVTGLTDDGGYSVDTAAHNGFRYEVVPEAIEEDAALIAHAPADLAALVAVVREVETVMAEKYPADGVHNDGAFLDFEQARLDRIDAALQRLGGAS